MVTNFEDTVIKSYPTGSRYICNPAPTDTDNDTIILVNGFYDYAQILMDNGWEDCGKEYDCGGAEFRAFRKGEENYIVTEDEEFFQMYVFATEGARSLNLLDKGQRVGFFQDLFAARGAGYLGLYKQLPAPVVQHLPQWYHDMFVRQI